MNYLWSYNRRISPPFGLPAMSKIISLAVGTAIGIAAAVFLGIGYRIAIVIVIIIIIIVIVLSIGCTIVIIIIIIAISIPNEFGRESINSADTYIAFREGRNNL